MISDQHDAVQVLYDTVNLLDVDAIAGLGLERALAIQVALDEVNRVLAVVRDTIPNALAPLWGEKLVEIPGTGVFALHVKKNRTQWDKEALLSAVLDSRIVDPETGEVKDESPLDRVLMVWNLGAPRTTALKARGIDADQYCATERTGFTIEKVG